MNFLPIFKYRLKDDLKAVGVFLLVTLLCMVLVIYGIMIMVSEIDDRVVSNFSIALTVFSFVIGIVTVREDLRLGIQNGVSRGTSLAACFTANVVASLAAALGEEAVTLEDLCEPYLMQMGFLTRTPRGRCATRLAYEHLGLKAPETGSPEDNGQQSLF